MTLQEIANLPMPAGDFRGLTIKGALRMLLLTLWDEKYQFSGKRPCGSSCWEVDFEAALVKGGALPGTFNEDDELMDCNSNDANAIIENVIKEIFQ